jgi:hypothetical protein
MDGYFFIQSDNVERYVDIFKQSKYINNVLINFDSISYIDDSEIQEMLFNYNNKLSQT